MREKQTDIIILLLVLVLFYYKVIEIKETLPFKSFLRLINRIILMDKNTH